MERPGGTIERVGGYRVVRRLATGGTADVLLAKAEGPHGFERTVVLKLLLAQLREDEDSARMFAREAAAYARLSHPCVVQLHDFFALEGQLVMVLEYVDGPPLNRLRGMLKAVGQQLDDQASIYVATRIFEALAAAHGALDDQGNPAPVIHRDVNPSNVLVQWDGQVKLADFGVAKVAGVTGVSRVGLLHGTFGYMAPEQVEGGKVTARADVYAGAVILWELLTRRRAFQRGALPEVEVLRQMAEPKIVSIDVLRPDLDKNVREAIRRALEPDPEKRVMTAQGMVGVLRAAVPAERGREHLGRALFTVRHEPRPATSIPPADQEQPTLGGAKPSVVPRAEISLKRTPSQPVVAERMSALPSTQPSPETPRMAPRDSIDDILRDIPSSIPPATFRGTRSAPPVVVTGTDDDTAASQAEAMDHTVAMVGAPSRPPPPVQAQAPTTQRTPPPRQAPVAPAAPAPPVAPAPAAPVLPPGATTLPLFADPRPASSLPNANPPGPSMGSVAPPPLGIPQPTSTLSAATNSGLYPDLDAPPPRKRSTALAVVAALGVLVLAGGAGTMGYMKWKAKPPEVKITPTAAYVSASPSTSAPATASASATASAPASASALVPVPASASALVPVPASASALVPASASASASASAPAPPAAATPTKPGFGILHTSGAPKGRRVYVDGVVMGQTPEDITVKCGQHSVKFSGKTRVITVPCEGEVGLF